jgi:anti-sigma regulatory factor (Ser/Thr protein kinase)
VTSVVPGSRHPHPAPDGRSGPSVRLSLAPEPQLLGTVRLVVASAGRRFGLDEEQIQDLKVAVSEVCTASIGALRLAGLDQPVELDLFEDGGRFGVEVRDHAPDRAHTPAPFGELGELVDEHDFSLALVESLAVEVMSGRDDDGAHVTRFWLDRT